MLDSLKQIFFEAEDFMADGKMPLAIKTYLRALDEAKKEDAEEFLALTYLAMAYDDAQDEEAAADFMKKSQNVAAHVFGAKSLEYATALSNEAMLHSNRGRLREAEVQLDRAVAILQDLKPHQLTKRNESLHVGAVDVLSNAGDCKAKLGKVAQAVELMGKAHSVAKSSLPKTDPRRIQASIEFGTLLAIVGRKREAESIQAEVMDGLTKSGAHPAKTIQAFMEAMANSAAMLRGVEQAQSKMPYKGKGAKASNVVPLFAQETQASTNQEAAAQGYQLKITLKNVKPAIWRRIVIDAAILCPSCTK